MYNAVCLEATCIQRIHSTQQAKLNNRIYVSCVSEKGRKYCSEILSVTDRKLRVNESLESFLASAVVLGQHVCVVGRGGR